MLKLEMGLVAVGLDTGEGTQRTLVRFIPGMPFLMPSKYDILSNLIRKYQKHQQQRQTRQTL